MKKILYIAPHLSTGGLPQYLYRKIVDTSNHLEVHCIEYENITGGKFIVQRKRIEDFLGSRFYTIGEDREEIFRIIQRINPDFIHLEEIPEYFLPSEIADRLYSKQRSYKIFETSHDSSFNPDKFKVYLPDAFFFVSQWQIDQYKNIKVPKYLAEYPIDFKERQDRESGLLKLGLDPSKKHVLNVGLFTPRKNQAEVFDVAKGFDDSVQFHFLGNQADNFKFYWEPLLKNKPSNCVVWGERSDTDSFYSCMDAFYFASRGNDGDKETMPLVLKESLGWRIPILMHNLDVYQGYFDKYVPTWVNYLADSSSSNISILKGILGIEKTKYLQVNFNSAENRIDYMVLSNHPAYSTLSIRVRDKITGLTFQPKVSNLNFIAGMSGWLMPSSNHNFRNGLLVEVVCDGSVIESYEFEDQPKTFWPPSLYPTTEIFYEGEKIKLHSDPDDLSSYWSYHETFISQDYKNIEQGDVVVDVGANLGFFTLFAIKEGASKVYSIEPVKSTFDYLEKNTEKIKDVIRFNFGVSNKNAEAEFLVAVDSSNISTRSDFKEGLTIHTHQTNKVKIQLVDFNGFITENNIEKIDYLKFDCEGAEGEMFESLDEEYLRNNIRKIAGEIHVKTIGDEKYSMILRKLEKAGFITTETKNDNGDLSIIFSINSKELNIPKIEVKPMPYEKEDICLLVQSCDSYEQFWDGWYKSMKRYWPWELGWKVYFMTEEKTPYFSTDPRIDILKVKGPDQSKEAFSTRMMRALEQIGNKYVMYFQEDMWPVLKPDTEFMRQGLAMMEREDWNCLRIQERLWGNISLNRTNYSINDVRVLKYQNSSEWLLAHHPSIWKREFLLENMREGEDPWRNEIMGSRRIYDKYRDSKIYHLNLRWYYQPGASQNGVMNPFMDEYLRNLNLTEELNQKFNIYG